MGATATLATGTTAGGYLLVLAIVWPMAGMLAGFVLGGRQAERIALALLLPGIAIAGATVLAVARQDAALVYNLGGWLPPLGVALRADGLSAALLMVTALIVSAVAVYARDSFRTPDGISEAREAYIFWTLLAGLWAALNAAFVGNDLFSLYVALELLAFSAVPLVSLDGRRESLLAALRYLMFALLGSAFYLLGVALIYADYATLDIGLLGAVARPDRATLLAAALMTSGLVAKTALFPLYFWLPPAHAAAPAPARALSSGLVAKVSFFILARLWFGALPGVTGAGVGYLLGGLGAAAILFGGVVALRQTRLPLLIAYSTVSQIGYLFLLFPLARHLQFPWSMAAWTGGWLQLLSHGVAKAAMFLSAGLIAEAVGHDGMSGLRGIGRVMPVSALTFGLAGLSLMGVPPSGGFAAKWILLRTSVTAGQWWWAVAILAGGLLAMGYVFRVIAPALSNVGEAPVVARPVAPYRAGTALALALLSVVMGLLPLGAFGFLQIGLRP